LEGLSLQDVDLVGELKAARAMWSLKWHHYDQGVILSLSLIFELDWYSERASHRKVPSKKGNESDTSSVQYIISEHK
jgi:hypothetical protein